MPQSCSDETPQWLKDRATEEQAYANKRAAELAARFAHHPTLRACRMKLGLLPVEGHAGAPERLWVYDFRDPSNQRRKFMGPRAEAVEYVRRRVSHFRITVVVAAVAVIGASLTAGRAVYAKLNPPPPPPCTTQWCQCFDAEFMRGWDASLERSMALNRAAIDALDRSDMAAEGRFSAEEKAEDAWRDKGLGYAAAEACKAVPQ
jgi:hypothetical protein